MRKTTATLRLGISTAFIILALRGYTLAASGTEGASFLDIPVGGRPSALGNSYAALASDAYAPIYNPAGLGFLKDTELAAMHLSYLETMSYEFGSFVHPIAEGKSLGVSVQYFSPGDVPSTNASGESIGTFTGYYGAYSVAYGQTVTDKLSLGLTGKVIQAKISDVSANAYAFDLGTMYRPTEQLSFAAVVANVGSKLTFIDQADALPGAFRVSAAYHATQNLNLTAEGDYDFSGLASGHLGVEFIPISYVSLRAGFRTDTTKDLSALAGFSTGIGLHFWGQELDYSWVPLGDLGSTQYLSIVLHFGADKDNMKNMQSHAADEKQNDLLSSKETLDQDILGASL